MEKKEKNRTIPAEFDQEHLMDYVKKYSFPRCIGSDGEKKVRRMIFKEFNDIGLKGYREEFLCSLVYSKWLLPISLILFLVLLIITQLLKFFLFEYEYNYIFDLFFIFIFFIEFSYILRKARKPQKFLAGKNYFSGNIFAFISSKNYKKNGFEDLYDEDFDTPSSSGNIIISAHSDSKSQRWTTGVRIKIFRYFLSILIFLFIGWVLTFALYLITETELKYTTFFSVSITVILIIFSIFLLLNTSGNESPGALDNATGIAIVLALAEHFKSKPLKHFNLWFTIFGVEEFGQPGATYFVLKRLRYFKRGHTFNFNIDMVGESSDNHVALIEFRGFRKKPVDPFMMNVIRQSSKELGLKVFGFPLLTGARTDRRIFTKFGYAGIDFTSIHAGKWSHSAQDTIDKINPDILQQTCEIISRSAQKIDEILKNKSLGKGNGKGRFITREKPKHLRQGYY
ncbi:MAG: M28 family metallopeptidase [Promethearchaeota archaeon]